MAVHDPFPKYLLAAWDSFCGEPDLALGELRRAISQNYCAYPQMETDPLLTKIRAMPEFAEIRSSGIACQQRFLEHRKQGSRNETVLPEELVWVGISARLTLRPRFTQTKTLTKVRKTAPSLTPELRTPI